MLRIPLLLVAALATSAAAQTVSSESISRVLTDGLKRQNLVVILRDLPRLGDRFSVPGSTVQRAFDQARVRDPFVKALFGDVQRIEIDGDRVTFHLTRDKHLPLQQPSGRTDGWLHLNREVKLRVTQQGRKIDKLKGVSASKTEGGIRLAVYGLEFSPTSVKVSAGKFGIAAFSKEFPIQMGGISGRLKP